MTISLTKEIGLDLVNNEDVEVILKRSVANDPTGTANKGKLYTKDVAGVTQLFYVASDGTIDQITPASGTPSPWNNTTTVGYITQNTTTNDVIIGGTTAPAAPRKLFIVNGVNPKGIRVEDAASNTNVLDFLKTGDTTTTLQVTGTTISFGPGVAAALDTTLSRIAGPLLNVNVGTRFGGNIERFESAWTIKTIRTVVDGNGDDITISAAIALAAAAGAYVGGVVTIQSGDSTANGANQAAGSRAAIIAGNAASGVGGTPVKGGDVRITTGQGADNGALVANNSGDVIIEDANNQGANVIPVIDQDGSGAGFFGKLGTRDAAHGGTDAVNARWNEVNAVSVVSGDMCFTDPGCPICGREFAEGDDIVLRVIKAEKFEKGYLTRTVPAHYGCKH